MVRANRRKLRVLWATDGSGAAHGAIPLLKEAVLPAAERLQVLTVAPHSFLSGARPDPAFLTRVTPAARRRALIEAQQTAESESTLLDPTEPVQALARWGNPIQEILRAARAMPADLIVMGAKGHSNLGLLLLGSVAQGVVQHATQSVLIARPGAHGVDRVVVGFDGSTPSRRAVDFVDRLALKPGVRFTLLRVVEPFAMPPGTPISYRRQAMEEAHKINQRNQRNAERTLKALAKKLEGDNGSVETIVRHGVAGLEIDALAREQHADLIVVGSRKPSPARHYLLGSTAEKLVRHAHTSVLVVR